MTEEGTPSKKKVLRVQVEFWQRGDRSRVYQGYTTDVSASGVFVACHAPFPRGTLVDLHFKAEDGLDIGATVARVVKVPLHLRRVMTSGMGLRFDDPADPAVVGLERLGKELSAQARY